MFQIGAKPKPAPKPEPEAKPAPTGKSRPVAVTVHLSPAQRERFEALGGQAWLRRQIDAAKPAPDASE